MADLQDAVVVDHALGKGKQIYADGIAPPFRGVGGGRGIGTGYTPQPQEYAPLAQPGDVIPIDDSLSPGGMTFDEIMLVFRRAVGFDGGTALYDIPTRADSTMLSLSVWLNYGDFSIPGWTPDKNVGALLVGPDDHSTSAPTNYGVAVNAGRMQGFSGDEEESENEGTGGGFSPPADDGGPYGPGGEPPTVPNGVLRSTTVTNQDGSTTTVYAPIIGMEGKLPGPGPQVVIQDVTSSDPATRVGRVYVRVGPSTLPDGSKTIPYYVPYESANPSASGSGANAFGPPDQLNQVYLTGPGADHWYAGYGVDPELGYPSNLSTNNGWFHLMMSLRYSGGVWQQIVVINDTVWPTRELFLDEPAITKFSFNTAAQGSCFWTIGGRRWNRSGSLEAADAFFSLPTDGLGAKVAMTEFWYAPGQYVDWTNPATRALCQVKDAIGATYAPCDIGATGSAITGSAPQLYLSGGRTLFPQNRAAAGTLTVYGELFDVDGPPELHEAN